MTLISETIALGAATGLLAYLGPGLGLSTLVVVLGVILSVFLAIVGVVWYPVKRLIRSFRRNSEPQNRPGISPSRDE